jgi:hypothetical protein
VHKTMGFYKQLLIENGFKKEKAIKKLGAISGGKVCPKCGGNFELRERSLPTKKQLLQRYWFAKYYICKSCKHVKNLNDYKVINEL